MSFLLLVLWAVLGGAESTNLTAKFIDPCVQTDASCLRASAQKAVPVVAAGIPSLNMGSLDPMVMERVRTVQAGLRMDFRNTIVKGMRKCEVLDLRRFPRKTEIDLKCSVILIGDYTLGGRLLILPIEGDGKYKIKIRDIVVKVALDIGEREADGERYWTVSGFKHTAEVLGGVQYQFQNLFNGNKQTSDTVLEFANSNWQQIFNEMAPPMVYAIVSHIVAETTKLFEKTPISELVL